MNKKNLIFLAGFLIIAVTAFILSRYINVNYGNTALSAENQDNINNSILLSLDPDAVSVIKVNNDTGSYTLVKDAGEWICQDIPEMPVANGKVQELLETFGSFRAIRKFEVDSELGEYGFDETAARIEFAGSDDFTASVVMGNKTLDGGSYYCIVNDGTDDLFTVPEEIEEIIVRDVKYYAQNDTMDYMPDPKGINVKLKSGEILDIFKPENPEEYTYTDYYSWFTNENGEIIPLDGILVNELLQGVLSIRWKTAVKFGVTGEELNVYGLKEPEAEITVTDEKTENTLLIGEKADDESYYAMKKGSDNVYTVTSDLYELYISANAESLKPNDICHMPWDTVEEISIDCGDRSVHISRKADNVNGGYTYVSDEAAVAISDVEDLKNIIDLMIPVGEDASGSRSELLMKIVFYRDADTYKELELDIYAYDDRRVSVDFEDNRGKLVSIEALNSLKEIFDKVQ